jgi:Tol biopolymer transport system component
MSHQSRRSICLPSLVAWAAIAVCGCSSASERGRGERTKTTEAPLQVFPKFAADFDLAEGRFADALTLAQQFLATSPSDCGANYVALIADTMLVVDSINTFILPYERALPAPPAIDQQKLGLYLSRLEQGIQSAGQVVTLGCEYDLFSLPLLIGEASDPIVNGEVRGVWTTRTASFLGAMHSALLYVETTAISPQPVPTPPQGQTTPPLPGLLTLMKEFLQEEQFLLFTQPTHPFELRGGWFDRNADGIPDSRDELLIDVFVPGTLQRVFDLSTAEFVPGQILPQAPLTPTPLLPRARCGYQAFHLSDIASGSNVPLADGVTLSPDGTRAAFPLVDSGKTQVNTATLDGANVTCITCGQPGNNDGARWNPAQGDVILFVSTRDHPGGFGGSAGGIGQELYAMRYDGSNATRLTFSNVWATNYHPNWSPDGRRVVWGRTQNRTFDVMVADFVSDEGGMRLVNPRRIVHDTTWWETHGFSADQRSIITTNTRAGFLSADIYSIDLSTLERKRLTSNLTWDEHAHLSPGGRKLAWISSRYQPAAVSVLNDGSLSPIGDFFWIGPGIYFEFENPPAGYSSELTLADADGTHLQQLTTDNFVVADNQWSNDARRIIFRQTNTLTGKTKIRLLTFDDCN